MRSRTRRSFDGTFDKTYIRRLRIKQGNRRSRESRAWKTLIFCNEVTAYHGTHGSPVNKSRVWSARIGKGYLFLYHWNRFSFYNTEIIWKMSSMFCFRSIFEVEELGEISPETHICQGPDVICITDKHDFPLQKHKSLNRFSSSFPSFSSLIYSVASAKVSFTSLI